MEALGWAEKLKHYPIFAHSHPISGGSLVGQGVVDLNFWVLIVDSSE